MSEIKRYTPNKIANEIMAEDAWHDSLWVRNEDYEELRKSRDLHWLDANKLRGKREKLEAELEALRADAERYRWLRAQHVTTDGVLHGDAWCEVCRPGDDYSNMVTPCSPEELDAAIDEARKGAA
jgi:hypothetical protein